MAARIKTSGIEVAHILIALVALAFAFSLALFKKEIYIGKSFFDAFSNYSLEFFVASLVTVGLAFVLHELGHKFVAERFGLWAEFRVWPIGLFFALIMAVFTLGSFIFAAPGATMIAPVRKTKNGFVLKKIKISLEAMGKIGLAGPVVNIVLAILFLLLSLATGYKILGIGAWVNAWLGMFNLIPFSLLDGRKVWQWSKPMWGLAMLVCVGLFVASAGAV
jgi:Zn-dependent protease